MFKIKIYNLYHFRKHCACLREFCNRSQLVKNTAKKNKNSHENSRETFYKKKKEYRVMFSIDV